MKNKVIKTLGKNCFDRDSRESEVFAHILSNEYGSRLISVHSRMMARRSPFTINVSCKNAPYVQEWSFVSIKEHVVAIGQRNYR